MSLKLEYTEEPPNASEKANTREAVGEVSREKRDLLSIVVEGKATASKLVLLQENYPDIFSESPTFKDNLFKLQEGLSWAEANLEGSDASGIESFKESYNYYAGQLNQEIFHLVAGENPERLSSDLQNGTREFVDSLNQAQQEEIEAFALAAWDQLFPPTFCEEMYRELKHTTSFDDLSLAYASGVLNGGEVAVRSVLSVFDPQVWADLRDAVGTLSDMDWEDVKNMSSVLKTVIMKADWSDRLFTLTTMIVSTLIVGGVMGRLKGAATAIKVPATIEIFTKTPRFSKAACILQLVTLFRSSGAVKNIGEVGQSIPAYSLSTAPFRII